MYLRTAEKSAVFLLLTARTLSGNISFKYLNTKQRKANMIIAGTGHRPDKLGGYSNEVCRRLVALASASLLKYKPEYTISGMALGWDQALAQASVNLGIPFIAAIPCDGQEAIWPESSRLYYKNLLELAKEIKMCGPGGPYAPWKMLYRDKWMVDNADLILALWNGSKGGTGHTVKYAEKVGKPYINLWYSWEKYKDGKYNSKAGKT
jgi:uncharacterized phage-like protein YoqJ